MNRKITRLALGAKWGCRGDSNPADADVGASDDRLDYVPFVQAPGTPGAVMVVPVGEQERAAITEVQQALIDRVTAWLDR